MEMPVIVKVTIGFVVVPPIDLTRTPLKRTTNTSDCNQTFGSFKTAMQKADRGIVAGGGLDFNVFGLGGLNLDARVVRGLTRLTTSTTGTTAADIKNQSVSLMLGYYLGVGR